MKKLLAIKLPSLLKGHPVRSQIDEIENGAEVNATNEYGRTPLYWAVYDENLEIAQLLIANGADLTATDKYGNTPLHWAAESGDLDAAQLLIANGADVKAIDKNGRTPLHSAVDSGNLDAAKLLIANGANVNATNQDRETPLHRAVINGHLATAQLLIENGADLTVTDNDERTPLHWASLKGDIEIAQLLEIVNHLDNNNSIDTLTSDIEHLTEDRINVYNQNKAQINFLMDQRKDSRLALSIVHDPYNVVSHPNLNKVRVINRVLVLMKVNKRLRNLPAISSFPVKKNSQWNFVIFGKDLQFFSLQDLGQLALVNREFYNNLHTQTELPSANNYLARLYNYLIIKNDGIQILINANKYRLDN